ncbi:MAG: SDR family oxidoreductase [bacterium]|nr:3-oxoacyl-ACP reductase [Deltaproteobacteria bacterium]MCP4903574.1 SDR family oxidoreductase [bacterium]
MRVHARFCRLTKASILIRLPDVEGKVALVTGGSRGIGRMIARGLVAAGAKVYIASRTGSEETARELSREGLCLPLQADLSQEAGLLAVAEALRSAEGALHVLVHSAGAHHVASLEDHSPQAWDELWSINVKAFFRLVQEFQPQLRQASRPGDPARVIALGSADGARVPQMDVYAYAASKAALHHLVTHLARRLARRGITVNAISPGAFPTDMLRPALEQWGEETVNKQVPMQRFGEPGDIEAAILYLVSRGGSYVTGAVLPVDGGLALV